MSTIEVDILNPKANKLLKNMEALELIAIRKTSKDGFLKVVKKIRAKASANPLSLEEITKEVELVRAKRYARTKR
jgi:uncharacterized UPF0146 family protein